jgi:hypothetical protein
MTFASIGFEACLTSNSVKNPAPVFLLLDAEAPFNLLPQERKQVVRSQSEHLHQNRFFKFVEKHGAAFVQLRERDTERSNLREPVNELARDCRIHTIRANNGLEEACSRA